MSETMTKQAANGSGSSGGRTFWGFTFQGRYEGEAKNQSGYEYLAVVAQRPDGSEDEQRFNFSRYNDTEEPSRIARAMETIRRGTKVSVRVKAEALPTKTGGQWIKWTALDMRAAE